MTDLLVALLGSEPCYQKKGTMEYPALTFSGFERSTLSNDGGAYYVGTLDCKLSGRYQQYPVVVAEADLLRQTSPEQTMCLIGAMFKNMLSSAHDAIDEQLERGAYGPR